MNKIDFVVVSVIAFFVFIKHPSSALMHLPQHPAAKQHFDQTFQKFDGQIPVHLGLFKPWFFLLAQPFKPHLG
ncbi:MAG: hypothetical protein WAV32_00385 [Halobacteriota archaeon]